MQKTPLPEEQISRALFIHLNEHGQMRVKTRLLLTIPEVAEFLRTSRQKAYWLLYRREIPSFHIGSRRFVSLEALEYYIREREIEEQHDLLSALEGYYRSYPFFNREPHPEVKRAQERLNAMQELQGQTPPKGQEKVSIEAALYHIMITEAGRLECTPRWLLSVSEAAELLGISRTSLYKLAKEDDFPFFHLNRRQYVRAESLLVWIRAKEHPERVPSVPTTATQKRKRSPKTETKSRHREG
jgi:excisionase family DNA binding protein